MFHVVVKDLQMNSGTSPDAKEKKKIDTNQERPISAREKVGCQSLVCNNESDEGKAVFSGEQSPDKKTTPKSKGNRSKEKKRKKVAPKKRSNKALNANNDKEDTKTDENSLEGI